MAKVAKPKKREASVHSRSFRRNATPPTEVAKPAKSTDENDQQWMYSAQQAGVHKKSKVKGRATRQQHLRHAKALEKADRNSAVLVNKVEKSKMKARKIQHRAKDWDELNGELSVESSTRSKEDEPVKDETAAMDGVEEDGPDHDSLTTPQVAVVTEPSIAVGTVAQPELQPVMKTAEEIDVVT